MTQRVMFVTGTGTGSGKTVLTALLLRHLRSRGIDALAMKPVCTGPRDDVHLLQSIQGNRLSNDFINPFYYKEPAVPVVASRRYKTQVTIEGVVKSIDRVRSHCNILLVEGAGGLMVPLNESGHTWADLLKQSGWPVIVAASNELGVINHILLTVDKLESMGINEISVSLMNTRKKTKKDIPERTNYGELVKNLKKVRIVEVPNIGTGVAKRAKIAQGAKKIEKTLAQILKIV